MRAPLSFTVRRDLPGPRVAPDRYVRSGISLQGWTPATGRLGFWRRRIAAACGFAKYDSQPVADLIRQLLDGAVASVVCRHHGREIVVEEVVGRRCVRAGTGKNAGAACVFLQRVGGDQFEGGTRGEAAPFHREGIRLLLAAAPPRCSDAAYPPRPRDPAAAPAGCAVAARLGRESGRHQSPRDRRRPASRTAPARRKPAESRRPKIPTTATERAAPIGCVRRPALAR